MTNHPLRIAIVGAGHVGSTSAYALMLRALVSEIVLIDSNAALAKAEAADIEDANALARSARVWAGDYDDAVTAAIAIITAGAATHGNESRLSVLTRSAAIVTGCIENLLKAGFAGIVLVAANPVDLMAQVAFRKSGFPARRVIGTGTLLDTSRLHQALAAKLDIAPGAVTGFVLGEHGDSEVTAFSTVRIGGVLLDDFAAHSGQIDRKAIAKDVRNAGYQILSGKGYTSFGIATAVVRICEAIIRNERGIMPVSTLMSGELGISGVFLSLPCVLGAGGVERVLVPELSIVEQAALQQSAEIIRQALATIDEDKLSAA